MSAPFLATITVLGGGGGAQPKGGGSTHLAMITPVGGGHISTGPVFPEGPTDPGYGRPDWGPVDPGFGGGVPVPPSVWPPMPPPPLPPDLESQVIVAIHRPGVTEWTVKAFPPPQLPQPKA